MHRLACVVPFLLFADAAAARDRCTPAHVEEIAALFRDTAGNVALLVARVRHRLETEDLQCWAKTGDKGMILELATRFEHGDGVRRDPVRAEQLYRSAASQSGGTLWIYMPGFNGQAGRVIPVDAGPVVPGLHVASYRLALMHLERRAAKPSMRKGIKMLEQLARQGHAPAVERLLAIPKT